MKTLRTFGLFLLVTLIFFGCDGEELVIDSSMNELTIAYSEAVSDYSPLSYEAKNRKYLVNIYEPLVTYDRTFNFETALAVSWGRLDDYTWEFHLREGVYFHDGTEFDAIDAIYSLQLAIEDNNSELGSLLSNIDDYTEIDDHKIQITTLEPDPLMLNKLTNVYMVPSGYQEFLSPIGTGPYYVSGFDDDTLILSRFDDYWGPAPYFGTANLKYIPEIRDRVDAILNDDVQILANVPPQYVSELENGGANLVDFPSLELSYLMLNTEVFADENLREAVWNALSDDYASLVGGDYLQSTSQYAPSGISGYSLDIEDRKQDLAKAIALNNEALSVRLDLPVGLDVLGVKIKSDLAKIGIDVEVATMPVADYEDRILSGESDMYFFGWKFDLADVADFYESVVHSPDGENGKFNGISYSNPELDELIDSAGTVLDVLERRMILDQITDQLLSEKYIIPLFESKVLYAVRPELIWDLRLDGYILASEIIENVVE